MAICKALKVVSVSISINGIEAKEYKVTDEEQHDYPKQTKLIYIESISGTNYAIVSKVDPQYRLKSALEFQIQVDNMKLPVAPLFVPKKSSSSWTRTTDGMEQINRKGKESKRLFKFSEIKLVDVSDKNRVRSDANTAKHVGEIRVTVFRKQVLEQTNVETGGHDNSTKLEIAEKAVKGQSLSHGTDSQRTNDSVIKEALQAEHIIPRAQSPDILHGFSEEDIRRIARERLSENQDNKAKIKKEINADGGLWAKRSTEDKSYTIDLTGDEIVEIEEAMAPKPPKETIDLCGTNETEPEASDTTDEVHRGGLFVADVNGGNGDEYPFEF
ncbi:hypothetical protein V502_09601 [Pseudogymnoascus sp. VKM F-4520 (FW-2644)]|nr:hypothetical protein V502_09601 [Pseudogymnoascus sp. VKM F-4520 (FW-2644)]